MMLSARMSPQPNGISISSAVFAKMTAKCLYTLQQFACFPSKLPIPMLASGPHLIRGSLGPPESGYHIRRTHTQL